ncbi:dTMP kinase [Legionella spiritensis]|uniref:Thymidylate kinase n=1 Tax=Legionella spiritensis TaxID=452 RepID=A0A0W0Z4G8_LEGSP|nr:dTMP kinase [Legionella spiritensis]KTD64027.1 thymidylate kinase [Legionella spiritensis]SNV37273.1 dTMP kinase [Legionella spiritensis]VEG90061.1 dTMP kinase [Legionella spiritensis]
MRPGKFIVVEGLEGAGKSTVIHTLQKYLETKVSNIIITREPGGTRVGEMVRTLIKDHGGEPLDSRTELLLLYAARTQLVEQVIRPALEKGHWIIADRFELSTYAYQGGGRHINRDTIKTISSISLQGFRPDLILFLDIKPQQGLSRVRKRGEYDRIEQESPAFFNDVYDAYHQMIRDMDNVVIIDAHQAQDIVQDLVLRGLEKFMESHV